MTYMMPTTLGIDMKEEISYRLCGCFRVGHSKLELPKEGEAYSDLSYYGG